MRGMRAKMHRLGGGGVRGWGELRHNRDAFGWKLIRPASVLNLTLATYSL